MKSLVLIISFGAFVTTILGGLFALYHRDKLNRGIGAFAAGALLAMALTDLIPESFAAGRKYHSPVLLAGLILSGFVFYGLLYSLIHDDNHDDAAQHGEHNRHGGRLGPFSLVIHSLFDGISIGLASFVPGAFLVVSTGVIAHDFSDGINTFKLSFKGRIQHALTWLLLDAAAPVVGANVIVRIFVPSDALVSLILAVLSGFFLYLGIHLFRETYGKNRKDRQEGKNSISSGKVWLIAAMGFVIIFAAVHLAGI